MTGLSSDPVVDAYSRQAALYDSPDNHGSCWGQASQGLLARLRTRADHELIVDVGCGAGGALAALAPRLPARCRLVGVEPADGLRARASMALAQFRQATVLDGRFESLPLRTGTVDYLFSIMAFHWASDPLAATRELARVLRPDGELDIFFIGRRNGREFIKATTPIFLRHMGPQRLLEAARLRQHLEAAEAADLFRGAFEGRTVEVREEFQMHFDTLDGHWAWWVRVEGQLMAIPEHRRAECDEEVRNALQALATPKGIPYTLHILRAMVSSGERRSDPSELEPQASRT